MIATLHTTDSDALKNRIRGGSDAAVLYLKSSDIDKYKIFFPRYLG